MYDIIRRCLDFSFFLNKVVRLLVNYIRLKVNFDYFIKSNLLLLTLIILIIIMVLKKIKI